MIVYATSIEKQRLSEACSKLDGFDEFYKAWKSKSSKQMLKTASIIAGILVLGGLASGLSQNTRVERDIRRIRDRLDRL